MKKYSLFLFFWTVWSCFSWAQTGEGNPVIAEGAGPERISSDFKFTEGPAADKRGNVYFTDQPNNQILKWSPKEGISVFMRPAGRSNGLYFDHEGNLLACADEKNELWRIGKNKKVTVLVSGYRGKRLNGPNDLWVDPKGGIYFTDPFYKRDYWIHSEKDLDREGVYYLAPDGKTLSAVSQDFVRPNGIIGTPDGKMLYIADPGARKIYSFTIGADGMLTDRREFAAMGSDGMTLDEEGNVYLTGKGVTVFDASGKQIAHIPIDEPWTANVCFGGKDRRTLFITASKSVFTVKMKVRGVRSWMR